MNLESFIERWKTSPFPFDRYEITDSEVVIEFDRIVTPGTYSLVTVPGNQQLREFSDLLDGRVCRFKGKEARGAKFAAIVVETFSAGH